MSEFDYLELPVCDVCKFEIEAKTGGVCDICDRLFCGNCACLESEPEHLCFRCEENRKKEEGKLSKLEAERIDAHQCPICAVPINADNCHYNSFLCHGCWTERLRDLIKKWQAEKDIGL